jgi:hypothetical protein
MSTSEMFTQSDDQSTENTEPMFIGEGKKYQDVLAADKALAFKEDHISKIEQENADIRVQLEAAKKVDDIIASIQNQQMVPDATSQTENENHQNVDMDALVAKAVNERMATAEQERFESQNSQSVASALEKRFGDQAKAKYLAKSQELGVDLDNLSRLSPKAVLEFFPEETSTNIPSNMSSSVNTASLNSGTPGHGTHSYWEGLQKEGKIDREEKFKQQHLWLEKLGPATFYGKN